MDILKKVKQTVEKYNMLSTADHVLVGLSGGSDSVCLLQVLNMLKTEYRLKISAAYIDHGLRPDDVPKEIEFCKQLCDSLNIPFYTQSIDVREFSKTEKNQYSGSSKNP